MMNESNKAKLKLKKVENKQSFELLNELSKLNYKKLINVQKKSKTSSFKNKNKRKEHWKKM